MSFPPPPQASPPPAPHTKFLQLPFGDFSLWRLLSAHLHDFAHQTPLVVHHSRPIITSVAGGTTAASA